MSNAQLSAQILSEDFPSFDFSFKIIIVGDSGVGKSCLSIKASRNFFEDFYSPTVGFEFLTFNVKVEDKNIKLQIWDTCGQEVYRSLISSFYRSASLAVIVYSINSEESYNNIEKWLNDIKTQSNPDVKIFLIGNKADLEDKREITKESGEKFAKEHNLTFFTETSAKTGFNVQNVFIEVAKELYRQHEEVKNRVSRPGSMAAVPYTPEITNNVSLETGEDDEDKKYRKKRCC
jgi:small GTP-binding protein